MKTRWVHILIGLGEGNKGKFPSQKILDAWDVSSSWMVIFSELVLIDLVNSYNFIYMCRDICDVCTYIYYFLYFYSHVVFLMLTAHSGVYIGVPYSADTPVPWFDPFLELTTTLLGQILIIYKDHKNLTCYNFNTDIVLIWRIILEEYGPDIKYIKGDKNMVADALSRFP